MVRYKECEVWGCHNRRELLYMGKWVCWECFNKHCDGIINLKTKLKIKEWFN